MVLIPKYSQKNERMSTKNHANDCVELRIIFTKPLLFCGECGMVKKAIDME